MQKVKIKLGTLWDVLECRNSLHGLIQASLQVLCDNKIAFCRIVRNDIIIVIHVAIVITSD